MVERLHNLTGRRIGHLIASTGHLTLLSFLGVLPVMGFCQLWGHASVRHHRNDAVSRRLIQTYPAAIATAITVIARLTTATLTAPFSAMSRNVYGTALVRPSPTSKT